MRFREKFLDIGPEGGSGGGKLVAFGTPEEVAHNDKSHTGKYLKRTLRSQKSLHATK